MRAAHKVNMEVNVFLAAAHELLIQSYALPKLFTQGIYLVHQPKGHIPFHRVRLAGYKGRYVGAAMLPGLQLDEMSLRESVRVLPLADGPIRTLTLLCQPKEDRSAATDELVRLVSALVRGAEA